jgi:cytochrome b involved in lipid metabolism
LSLAGDAFCLAATALRLAVLPSKEQKPELPEVNLKQVAFHDSANDCWIIIYDLVYDVTSFLDKVRTPDLILSSFLHDDIKALNFLKNC